MALKDLFMNMQYCCRCSLCKWVPMLEVRSAKYAYNCPSISKYGFHAYSGSGKSILGLSLLGKRADYSDEVLNAIYRCQACGACDISCHDAMEMVEPLDAIRELRIKCVEDGQIIPAHQDVIDWLKKEDNTMRKLKADRGKWAKGLHVKDLTKEKAEVAYHAGCRYSFDEELSPMAKAAVTLLKKAGIDVGIMGKDEVCCGGRSYEVGYMGELTKYHEHNMESWRQAGVKTVVTSCSDCYGAFKSLYPMVLDKATEDMPFEVLHITEYLDRLIQMGKLKAKTEIPLHVTYHDPCHLGRLGEDYKPWHGEYKHGAGQILYTEPQKQVRHGMRGIYEPPRNILKSIPGLQLTEMERIKRYSWCCGAGGGVKDAYPDFAMWSANERIDEAKATGAEALVTACPWCNRNFKDAIAESGEKLKILDVVELLEKSI